MFTLNCVWVNKTAQGRGNDEAWMTGQSDVVRKMARWDVVVDCQMPTHTIIQTYKHTPKEEKEDREKKQVKRNI